MTKQAAMLLSASLLVVFSGGVAAAQDDSNETLMQGNALTEAEAIGKLRDFAGTYDSAEQWKQRATRIRKGILAGAQLERRPEPCPLSPIRHSKLQLDGYSVENVAFQSLPGYWVTGNLYLPAEPSDSMPGVLCPHGHAQDKRLKEDVQTRCAALARTGAVVYAYDMVGYAENEPCPHDSPGVLRLQTYNSTRAVDFLLSLPGVDDKRLAVTGASGGGTQSFLLAAIDDRIDVSVPVVQVSAHFYGGCECESGMPIHKRDGHETNNVEIAASFAPKPQLIISDGADWTKNVPLVEFPYIQRVYSLLDAADAVENAHFGDEGHDYGPSKRRAAYKFLAKHLGLDLEAIQDDDGEITEEFVTVFPMEALYVFDAVHPRPDGALLNCEDVMALLDIE